MSIKPYPTLINSDLYEKTWKDNMYNEMNEYLCSLHKTKQLTDRGKIQRSIGKNDSEVYSELFYYQCLINYFINAKETLSKSKLGDITTITYGSELVINGNFEDADNSGNLIAWQGGELLNDNESLSKSYYVDNGVFYYDNTNKRLSQDVLEVGKTYKLSINVVSLSSDAGDIPDRLVVYSGDNIIKFFPISEGLGVKEIYFIATSTRFSIFSEPTGFDDAVSNISIKEVTVGVKSSFEENRKSYNLDCIRKTLFCKYGDSNTFNIFDGLYLRSGISKSLSDGLDNMLLDPSVDKDSDFIVF